MYLALALEAPLPLSAVLFGGALLYAVVAVFAGLSRPLRRPASG
ncbi:MAG: hypothetical protein Q4G43_17050 [Mobilicoccus sp.]|nr:hypothetical protein [Mobilicoccus sp.]